MRHVLQTLLQGGVPERAKLAAFVDSADAACREELFAAARRTAQAAFGTRIYVRGLIEFTNYCTQDCLYCGIRRSNPKARRYRMTRNEILECCATGYGLGFRTFVLQGGEDPWFTEDRLVDLVTAIKTVWPDCAVTLSVGEKSAVTYARLRQAGADRYLLRHETATLEHFARLHPLTQTWHTRHRCLMNLRELGFQVGAGFMVGSPGQTTMHLVDDLLFLRRLNPQMAGIGPFIPHQDTPLGDQPAGDVEKTLMMVALTRLLLPHCLIPATTALGTVAGNGRERGILAGANVLMPNLSPPGNRDKYMLYDGKIFSNEEAAENRDQLARRLEAIGYQAVTDRGDYHAAAGSLLDAGQDTREIMTPCTM